MWYDKHPMTTLPTCPFCGGKPSVTAESLDERSGYAYVVRVHCTGCGASLQTMSKSDKAGWNNEPPADVQARAEAMWSKRTQ